MMKEMGPFILLSDEKAGNFRPLVTGLSESLGREECERSTSMHIPKLYKDFAENYPEIQKQLSTAVRSLPVHGPP